MKAGIDLGLTHTKAYWLKDGQETFLSTADGNPNLEERLREAGVTKLCVAGANVLPTALEAFPVERYHLDPIESEITLQTFGARKLLENDGVRLRHFLCVSIGTGTSYTAYDDDGARRFPYGSAVSGGTVEGLMHLLAARKMPLDLHTELGGSRANLDLTLGEAVPATKDTPLENLVVSHFGTAKRVPPSKIDDALPRALASLINMVATSTVRDLMILDMVEGFSKFDDVVFVGTAVARTPALRETLAAWLTFAGKNAHFPARGEYALAVGAYHGITT